MIDGKQVMEMTANTVFANPEYVKTLTKEVVELRKEVKELRCQVNAIQHDVGYCKSTPVTERTR